MCLSTQPLRGTITDVTVACVCLATFFTAIFGNGINMKNYNK